MSLFSRCLILRFAAYVNQCTRLELLLVNMGRNAFIRSHPPHTHIELNLLPSLVHSTEFGYQCGGEGVNERDE